MVTEPDIRSPEEAAACVRAVRRLVRWLGISDGNMEEGSLRCDANISLRLRGAERLGTKAEIKNMNSFKNVRDALEHEIKRQAACLDRGERIAQETRLWDPVRGATAAMRSKEQDHDYRYFPEPDLPPLVLDEAQVRRAQAELPELPEARLARYEAAGVSSQEAGVLASEKEIGDYYDTVVETAAAKNMAAAKRASAWVVNEVLAKIEDPRALATAVAVPPKGLAELLALIEDGTLSGKLAKDVFGRMWREGRGAAEIVATEGVAQVSDGGVIEDICRQALAKYAAEAARYRAGETKLLGFLVGAVMTETSGKANPKTVNETLRRLLT
jgi:aspartyl-tRNA(Asn)/glutamyl-tRNA(Gln) amidotransferase subunit B